MENDLPHQVPVCPASRLAAETHPAQCTVHWPDTVNQNHSTEPTAACAAAGWYKTIFFHTESARKRFQEMN